MQRGWVYNHVGFIRPLPSQHSKRICDPLPTLLSEVENWGTEILWKTRKQTQTSQSPVQQHDHWAITSQAFLQWAVWAVSRSALVPGAICLAFPVLVLPSQSHADVIEKNWILHLQMDRWTFSYNGGCTAMNGPSGLQLIDKFTDRITGDDRNTLSSPKVDLWWHQNQGFSPAEVPRVTPGTWCALLHKIPVA